MNTWNLPLYMTLIDKVAMSWEDNNGYDSNQGKDSTMDNQLVVEEEEKNSGDSTNKLVI